MPFPSSINKTLSFDSLAELREEMVAAVPVFARLDDIQPAKWGKFGKAGKLKAEPVEVRVKGVLHDLCNLACVRDNGGMLFGNKGG